ncbi:hypothetical protein DDJ31_31130 [Streptomyces griseoviridis]|uniref:Uncharacterized protein n=1 Tax=Streptomyces griseoviridis TaxID=45398 RepID=A0ABX5U153_STRGD|nr:hypothetical protein DDJ31_31130 [Streptomyces griseoviridis]
MKVDGSATGWLPSSTDRHGDRRERKMASERYGTRRTAQTSRDDGERAGRPRHEPGGGRP